MSETSEFICRGAYALGTACGLCAGCEEQRLRMVQEGRIADSSHQAAFAYWREFYAPLKGKPDAYAQSAAVGEEEVSPMPAAEAEGAVEEGYAPGMQRLDDRPRSVLQDWVLALPLRFQGTLLTAVRGCDLEAKHWVSTGVAYSPGRRLTAFIRYCFMHAADLREVDSEEGAFFQSSPPYPFKPSEFGHLPQHWYAHAMHALEVIGYHHPDAEIRDQAYLLYYRMVRNLHLRPESREEQWTRLTEDRIATGTVVS